jgi:biotin carboxylase
VDLIVRDGAIEQLGLIDKFLIDDRYFELGFASPPFDLPPYREERIRPAVDAAVRALGLDNTVAHVEVIDDRTLGPTIVEVNPGRPGGQAPLRLNLLTTGVDMVAELVAVHRGAPSPRTPPPLPVPLASLCLFSACTGRLRALHGLDEVAAHPDVVSVTPAVEPGAVLSDDYEVKIATVVVAGFLDRDDLVKTYHELAGMVRLELEPS